MYRRRLEQRASPVDTEAVRAVLKGNRREHRAALARKDLFRHSPLAEVLAAVPVDTLTGLRDRAVLLVGFAGALLGACSDVALYPMRRYAHGWTRAM